MNYSELTDPELNRLVSNKYFGNDIPQGYDFLNDPSDAWPIIEEIWEHLNSEVCPSGPETVWIEAIDKYKCSKLRAAMIVYLMMGDE